jgi:Type IX secretion system protein PorV
MKKNTTTKIVASIFGISVASVGFGQTTPINYNQLSGQALTERMNTITTAVPFVMISPDARAAGMGDAGGSSSADANSIHWNVSKLAFTQKKFALSVSYTPWLRKLVPDINLAYVAGYYSTKAGVFTGSLRYFSLGEIVFTDVNGTTTGQFKPNEFALDAGYAKALSETFAIGGTVRFINSNLTNGSFVNGSSSRPGRAIAVDISTTYKNDKLKLGSKKSIVTGGLGISNIGNKVSYSDKNSTNNTGSFLPINMKLSGGLTIDMDKYNSIGFILDINKLLVPTSPVYEVDANGNTISDGNGGYKIAYGKDPNRGVASGMFGSFNDAPGGGKEELHEINYAGGLEYWYNKLFAVRAGYFYEHPTKGARQYMTLGAGIKYNVFGLDFAYLIPTQQQNPLQNTLRFSLLFDFDAFGEQGKTVD